MAEILLFHHLQGRTDGVRALADALGAGGHTVHVPDLFDGELPGSVEEGSALTKRIGADVLDQHADRIAAELRPDLVYAGVSWGAAIAQRLAQTRPGARAALLYEACLPVTGEWAIGPWPDGVAVQVHGMERDPFFGLEGDVDAARELVSIVGPERGELFVYPGDRHLFTDRSLPSYDAEATALVVSRSRDLLDRLG
ncbi:dienelactone hydrolase family protein [Micromonospora sp. WMMC241]|uniref:dienelactone hydrolase family protein n=1 Tax=Micromonospora sp. WMMC241 TaxID=3015159 RepID=UPI0022B605E3|nr:dienelactone hydrolase family protein [Micromonospora sp. WMMC241]MCZ7440621.1 dienelactone hydrolase family protein [Micromonospora sp. WMMC241]